MHSVVIALGVCGAGVGILLAIVYLHGRGTKYDDAPFVKGENPGDVDSNFFNSA